jgi:hypothetical protein
VNSLPTVARYLKLNFNPKIKNRLQDAKDSLELGGVILGSPKRSKQELKEAAQWYKDAADALAVEKRALLDDNEVKVPLKYMHALFVCAVDVGAVCACFFFSDSLVPNGALKREKNESPSPVAPIAHIIICLFSRTTRPSNGLYCTRKHMKMARV